MGEPRAYFGDIEFEKERKEYVFFVPKYNIMVILVADFDDGHCFFDGAYSDMMEISGGRGDWGLDYEELLFLGEL